MGEFDWFETPLVKLILSKESKGSFNAYNITGWRSGIKKRSHFKVFESSFSPKKYHLEKMTIAQIQYAQENYIGSEYRHLFAVGAVQMIPSTLKEFLVWLGKYKSINCETQLFDEAFQRLTPMFFWEKKVSSVSLFFRGNMDARSAAYAISKEWASAGVPEGLPTKTNQRSNGSLQTYYDDDPVNKAHYSAIKTIEALELTKKMIDDAGGYDLVREMTLSKIRS
ncbi:hypothetical protein HYE53_00815 [Aggregatibacter actinomycetemcomitans]|nr:hypothetical protein [Aggregatibacter actinomycetemcomitans]